MLCQMCLQAEATIRVCDPATGKRPVQADYCRACHDRKYVHSPARPPDFPRPKFAIRRLMILTVVFAIPNAAIVLVMRSGRIQGTPAQVRDWTLQAFLFVNFFCALMVAYTISIVWLNKVKWHRWTGGLIPMGRPRKLGLKRNLFLIAWLALYSAWLLGGMHVVRRLAPIVWPKWPLEHVLIAWIIANALLIWGLVLLVAHRQMLERGRAMWKGASGRERFFWISIVLWTALIPSLVSRLGWWSWSADPLISSCIVAAVLPGGTMLLCLGLATLTRHR